MGRKADTSGKLAPVRRVTRLAAAAGLTGALLAAGAGPVGAGACPPDRPLCWLVSPSSPAPAPVLSPGPVPAPAPAPVTTLPPPPPTVAPPPVPVVPHAVPEAARRLLDLVNAERARAGLGRLVSRDDVVAIALAHSNRMVAAGTIFHNDSYFSDATRDRLASAVRGENVAQNSSVDDTHTRLMNSPGHRANILDPRFNIAGFGVVQAGDGRYYTTQNFLQGAGAPPPPVAPRRATPAPAPAVAPGAVAPPPATAAPPPTTPGPAVVAPHAEPAQGRLPQLGGTGHRLATSTAPLPDQGPSAVAWTATGVLLLVLLLSGAGIRRHARRVPHRG